MFGLNLLDRAAQFLVGRHASTRQAATVSSSPAPRAQLDGTDQVLTPHAALLCRIRNAYGHEEQQFHQHLFAPITELAAWVHFLPGLPGSGFERPGGTFELALTTSLFCLQAADGRTFDGSNTASPSPSQDGAQRWRLACALGGLFAGLPKFLGSIEVASDEGELWPASAMPLVHWLGNLSAPRYRYRWIAGKEDAAWPALYVASRCISQVTMSYMIRDGGQVASGLLSCISAVHGSATGPVSDVVSRVVQAMASREQVAAQARFAGQPSEPQPCASSPPATDGTSVPESPSLIDATDTQRSSDLFEGRDALEDRRAVGPESEPLALDTSLITNPRVREQVEDVVNRLEGSFDTMLALIVPGGIFVALQEFVGQHADGAAVVRAVHEAGLLALDASTASRRVSSQRIEGADVPGVILRAEALRGYSAWAARWQESLREGTPAMAD